jgi:hypothetical protein
MWPVLRKHHISPRLQVSFLCEIIQLCCIPLRDLRNLRENNTQEYSINPHKRNPKVSRRSRRFTQTNPKQQNSLNLQQPVFLCEIMQLAAFVCVICVICGRITRKNTQSILHTNETPMSHADHADKRRQTTKPQNNISNNLSFSAK